MQIYRNKSKPKMQAIHKSYYEGVLQLRNIDNEVIEFSVSEISKNNSAGISKVKNVKNGVDIYVTRQKFLRSLGNKLQSRFGGQLIVSTKLHTRNRITSREVHRVNMLFRTPKFKKGDIIEYNGTKIKIINTHKKVFAKDIKTGKKLNLNYKDLFQ